MKVGLLFRKEFKVFLKLTKYLFCFYIRFCLSGFKRFFFFLIPVMNLYFYNNLFFFKFNSKNSLKNKSLILFFKGFCSSFSSIFFFLRFFVFRLFKSHGINMRVILNKNKSVFFRVGTSHGFLVNIPNSMVLRVFKKRYFFIFGYDLRVINFFSYHFRFFRKFFKYKLIGIKYIRDSFRIKIGKKKAF